jgi:signal transduction histidine kinase
LSLRLDAAQNRLHEDPEESIRLLRATKEQVQNALKDIRRLVYNLRPPALDELGLVPALRQEAETVSAASEVHVEVDVAEALPPLSAALEVATYRIVIEAVNNVIQHAEANRCRIRLRGGEDLSIKVWDDGKGIPADLRIGVGITSMRERTKELGGRFEISKAPQGGTVVHVRLPLLSEGE